LLRFIKICLKDYQNKTDSGKIITENNQKNMAN